MLKKVLNVAFWVLFAILLLIWVTDFLRVRADNDPIFCWGDKVHTFDDGDVEECTGLGYKVFKYNRDSLGQGSEFGPFFIKMQEPN